MTVLHFRGSALVLVGAILALSIQAYAADLPPDFQTVDPTMRALRSDAVKTWYVYTDENTDHGVVNGILDPGDTQIATFQNWWTPISSHSQYNMSVDYGSGNYHPDVDISAGPINGAASLNPGLSNYWLPREANAIHFYMSYSQWDNADWKGGYDNGQTGDTRTIMTERHENRNGYTLGWVTSEKNGAPGALPQTPGGTVDMDIFVHSGRGVTTNPDGSVDVAGFGKSYSNPQLSAVNDINADARDYVGSDGGFHPLQFDGDTPANGYSWAENQTRMNANFDGSFPQHGPALSDPQQQVKMAAMELYMESKEFDPAALGDPDVVVAGMHPEAIRNSAWNDHSGADYLYEDAFLDRSVFHNEANDGAVIAGLAGESTYNAQINNWGDQQVIRIDISPATLAAGNIDKIVIYDFTDQLNPGVIILDVKDFPDGRFYIAQAEIVPEPATAVLLLVGGACMAVSRRRRRQRA